MVYVLTYLPTALRDVQDGKLVEEVVTGLWDSVDILPLTRAVTTAPFSHPVMVNTTNEVVDSSNTPLG